MRLDIAVAVLWGLFVAGFGAWLTELTPWYHELKRPSWQPPDWVFGPAWTVILALASWSAWLAWQSAVGRGEQIMVILLFAANGLANLGWSLLFFRLRRPDWALMEVALLWLTIFAPIVLLRPLSLAASLTLVPYLLWVTFAAFLNRSIVRLNAPFGE